MSWLHSFLSVLNEDEIQDLRRLRLIGKEKEVFDYLLSSLGTIAPSQETVCSEIQLSDSHYYKINSILMDKLFIHFVPEGDFKLLEWLRSRELYAILKNEIKAQQKQLHSNQYYLDTFRLLIDLPYKYYDENLTKSLGKSYLGSLKPCMESDTMYVKFHLIFADCNRFAASKNPALQFRFAENDLLKLVGQLVNKNHSLALYYLYRTLCNYYKYYKKNSEQSLHYLDKAIQLKDEIAEFFPINIHQFLRLLYADELLSIDKSEEAFSLYSKVFQEGINEKMYGYFYHCEQYAICAILLKKFDFAEALLLQHFESCIKRKNDIYATRGALAFAKLYLSNGELKKALQYIQLGISINEKTFYLPFEIQLRTLENIYFFLQGDTLFAKQLAQRNAKYITNQKAEELIKNYRHFFKMITSFLVSIEKGKPVPVEIEQEYVTIEKKFRTVYCHLINQLHAKTRIGVN